MTDEPVRRWATSARRPVTGGTRAHLGQEYLPQGRNLSLARWLLRYGDAVDARHGLLPAAPVQSLEGRPQLVRRKRRGVAVVERDGQLPAGGLGGVVGQAVLGEEHVLAAVRRVHTQELVVEACDLLPDEQHARREAEDVVVGLDASGDVLGRRLERELRPVLQRDVHIHDRRAQRARSIARHVAHVRPLEGSVHPGSVIAAEDNLAAARILL